MWSVNLINHVYLSRLISFSGFIVLTFLLGNCLPGCAGLGKRLESPKINVSNIRLKEIKALESIFQLELRVFNANDIPITIKGIDCELDLNNKRFAMGVSNDEATVPSFGTEIIPILVYSSVLDVFRGVLGLQHKESLKYKIKGKILLDAGSLAPSTVPFQSEGDLSFERVFE